MFSYTCNQVRSAVALAHIDGAPAARLPANPSSPISALHHSDPSPLALLSPRFPLSLQQRLKRKKKKSKLVLGFFLRRQLSSWNSWNYFLEAAPVEWPAARTERNSFPSFGKEWSSLRSHRRKSSASLFGSQTVKVAAHLQTPTCTFFFCSVRAHSALSLVLCRAALRLLSHPLLLPGRTSSQSGAVTHFSDSDCLDETTVPPPPSPHGVAAAAPACARPVNYQQQRRHCRWSHRSPRLFLSPPQLRHCSPDSCILCLVAPPTQPHPRFNACTNHSAFLLLCGALRPGLLRVLDFFLPSPPTLRRASGLFLVQAAANIAQPARRQTTEGVAAAVF